MCGIFSYFSSDANPFLMQELWDHNKSLLIKRGKDSHNSFLLDNSKGIIAGTRLAIVDSENINSSNVQVSEDKKFYLAFNGQIYNHLELRKLVKKWSYKTESDTEVLFSLLIELGIEKTLELLEGMFAFIFYDTENGNIFAAVDEAGQKPLFYRIVPSGLMFSSDLRGLLTNKLSKLSLSIANLAECMYYRFPPLNKTLYKEVFKLTPGEILTFNIKSNKVSSYTYRSVKSEIDYGLSESEAILLTREKLIESVNLTLGPEKKVAVYLSGGIDSTAVADIAKKFGKSLETYSIGFEDVPGPVFSEHWYPDEFLYSRSAARQLGSLHHEERLSMKHFFKLFEEWSVIQGDPLLVLDSIPLLHLSKMVSVDYKYVLTGSGSDEIFDGYNADTLTYAAFLAKTSKNIEELYENYLTLNSRVFGADLRMLFPQEDAWNIAKDSLRQSLLSYNLDELDFFTIAKLLMYRGRRANYEFAMLDRTGMYYSVEARNPFAQKPIAYLALSLPQKLHTVGNMPKGILREALKGVMPEDIRIRKKAPFAMPSSFFFSNIFEEMCQMVFDPNSLLNRYDIINSNYLKELWRSPVPGHRAVFPRLVQIEFLLNSQKSYFNQE